MPIVLPNPIVGRSSGSPEVILLGSGQSHLGGVESYFVYEDLLMNDRQNIDTYIIKEIDGLADPDLRDSRETIPQAHGEHAFNSWYGGRTIVLNGTIRAHNIFKLRDMQDALKETFASLEEKPLRIVSPYQTAPHHEFEGELERPSVEIMCKKSQPIQMRDIQQNYTFTRDFLLTLRASNPFFKFPFASTYSDATITSPHNISLVNIGNYVALPKIIFGGPMTNPQLTNNENGQTIQIAATIPTGESWIFDVDERSFVDGTGANKFSKLNINSDWLSLDSGDNELTLTFTGGSGATSIALSYRHTWI